MSGDDRSRVVAQVRQWRDELIDLSRRNGLLNVPKTSRRSSHLIITSPNHHVILDRLISQGRDWRFHYPPAEKRDEEDSALMAALEAEDPDLDDDIHDDELVTDADSPRQLSAKLHRLERKSSTEFLDKGLRVLYLGFGILEWDEAHGEIQRSPLVLVPVTLVRPSPREPFRLVATDDDAVFNPALELKLDAEFGITLTEPEDLVDIDKVLASVKEAVEDSYPTWRVLTDVTFGAFSFHKEAMYRDLKDNEAAIVEHSAVRLLADDRQGPDAERFQPGSPDDLDDRVPPEEMASILDADATQRECIRAGRDGHSFVMDGPPGTGKSQTIANLIAELLAGGRTVLFVSEKAAALDVVRKRLDAAGLGHFILEMHSHKATRRDVAQSLGEALNQRPRVPASMSPTELEKVRERRKALNAYAWAQNEVREPFGRSLHWAIGRRIELGQRVDVETELPIPDLPVDLDRETYDEIVEAAGALAAAWDPVERGDSFVWRDLGDAKEVQRRMSALRTDLQKLASGLRELRDASNDYASQIGMPPPQRYDDSVRLAQVLELLADRPEVPLHWLTEDLDSIRSLCDQLETLVSVHDENVSRLEALKDDWRSIDPAIAPRLQAASAALVELVGLGNSVAEWTTTNVEVAAQVGDWLASKGADLAAESTRLESLLGLEDVAQTVDGLRNLIEVLELCAPPERPEVEWFEANTLMAARGAVSVLKPLVLQHQDLTNRLRAVFNDQIFVLDVESLYDGPSDLVPNLSRWNAAGKLNRKQLKSCTLAGDLSGDVTAALPLVRQWRAIADQLASAESVYASLLGSFYYRSAATDFVPLESALQVAEQILAKLQTNAAPELLARRLCRESIDAWRLVESAGALRQRLEQWTATIRGYESLYPQLPSISFAKAAEWGNELHSRATQLLEQLRLVGNSDALLTVGAATAVASDRASIENSEAGMLRCTQQAERAFGEHFAGLATDFARIGRGLEWADKVRRYFGGPLSEATARSVLDSSGLFEKFKPLLDDFTKWAETIEELFSPDYRCQLARDLKGMFDDAQKLIDRLTSTLGDIEVWVSFDAAWSRLRSVGLDGVVRAAAEDQFARDDLASAIEAVVLSAWIDAVLATDGRCGPIRAEDRELLVREFQEIDRALVAHAAAKVIETCNARRPKSDIGAVATVRKEAEKKKRHMPIRKLLEKTGSVAQDLRPCFMMSPLTVSQFLPPTLGFDVVIFDEASQVRPGDAIGAIYRSDQLIVAGDNRQLPPTSFFDRSLDDGTDEWDEEQLDSYESILDLCRSAALPQLPLLWHYRSRHESLITFSNRAFYDGKLISYPGSVEQAPDVGVEFIHVPDGVYQRGGARDNPVEARAVVERVLWHARRQPQFTLGVVAFSEAQATRISQELEYARRDHPDLDDFFNEDRLNGFFIRNLENVQGDERDIVIFSVGYGPDEVGKLTMNFGPLNRDGGYRRLNVAITRARRRVEVVTSITAADIRETASDGVRHLRNYLDYVQRGPIALTPVDDLGDGNEPESPFEESVSDLLKSWGHDVVPQVGQAGYRIDIGVRHPSCAGRFALGIECDGAAYHSSRVARDRDRLRQEVLEGLGWRLHRIWGPSWYRDRAAQEARLRDAIAAAISGDEMHAGHDATAANSVQVDVDTVDLAEPPEWVVPYVAQKVMPHFDVRGIDDSRDRGKLRDDIRTIVRREGPVHRRLLFSRLRAAWHVGRIGTRIRDAVEGAIASLVADGEITEVETEFLSWPGAPDLVRVPVDGKSDTARRVDEVSDSELGMALKRLISDARAAPRDELAARIARIFGWNRTGSEIARRVATLLNDLTESGEIGEDERGNYRPAVS